MYIIKNKYKVGTKLISPEDSPFYSKGDICTVISYGGRHNWYCDFNGNGTVVDNGKWYIHDTYCRKLTVWDKMFGSLLRRRDK